MHLGIQLRHCLWLLGEGLVPPPPRVAPQLRNAAVVKCEFAYEQQACYEEQLRHVGKDFSEPVDYDALKECTLLDRCLKETLRLRPPIVTMMRMCRTPQVIICHLPFNELITCVYHNVRF